MKAKYHIGIVGAGFAGSVVARELAEAGDFKITVFDERPHVAGNCHTERDPSTQILIHQYGPHIFHTNNVEVWQYINRFGTFFPFTNRVKAITKRGVFSLPINLLTINQFFGKRFNPQEARKFLESLTDPSILEPSNFEEQALKMVGREIYENFFYGYTKKQWGVEPHLLPAGILKRLPIRFDYNDNYYNSFYQGIPQKGYTHLIQNLLDHPHIEVRLQERFEPALKNDFSHLFYSGTLDGYFGFQLGELAYRTLKFERSHSVGDFQGNPVVNYCESEVPYTRITEHKHFAPWEEHHETILFYEFSKRTELGDIPYYPLNLAEDKKLFNDYKELANLQKGITFIGRLGTYRYLDMHQVIGESLELARHCLKLSIEDWPRFPNF